MKVRVYEKQWGSVEMTYIRFFKNWEEALNFSKETGYKVERV
jgi:hypothetical protein